MEKEERPVEKPVHKTSPDTPRDFPEVNPEQLQKEFQNLVKEKFGGHIQVLSMGEALPEEEVGQPEEPLESIAVSYTHLTLPTR